MFKKHLEELFYDHTFPFFNLPVSISFLLQPPLCNSHVFSPFSHLFPSSSSPIFPHKLFNLCNMTLLFLLLFLFPLLSHGDHLLFNGFHNSNLTLTGISTIHTTGLLQLTNSTPRLLGHAFHNSPFRFKSSNSTFSFSTAFAFAIVPQFPKLGGHGMAFAITPSNHLQNTLPSQYLGLLNSTDNGNLTNHLLAVEFDTVTDFEFGDINDNHIGIDINSMRSKASASAAYFDADSDLRNLSLQSGDLIFAWIDYDAAMNRLDVKLSPKNVKPRRSVLSFDVDLSPYLDEFMYVGFSASTGLLASSHYVMGWSFNVNGEALPLDAAALPSIPKAKGSDLGLVVGVSVGAVLGVVLALVVALGAVWWVRNRDVVEEWELNVGPHRFGYSEVSVATKGFREKEVLGFGGFGKVYKGTLSKTGVEVAVKRISNESKQGFEEFVAEIATIGKLRHRNLVQLLGWSRRRGDLLLVYDFMPNGSLDKYLFDQPLRVLSWKERFNIVKGVASGLLYLHEGWDQTVIHRDVKAGNVLLDGEMNGRLGDFGLAKLYEHGSNPNTTRVVGTMGYLAPELTRTGKPTTSSDVFAFGAFLLEVACGRRPIEPKALPEELVLVDHVCDRWKSGAVLSVMDQKLKDEYDEAEAVMVLKLGLMCSADKPEARPTMRQLVRYLEGELDLPEVVVPPGEKGGGFGGGDGSRSFGGYLHSYAGSSFVEGSTWTSNADCDVEGGSMLSLSTSGEGR